MDLRLIQKSEFDFLVRLKDRTFFQQKNLEEPIMLDAPPPSYYEYLVPTNEYFFIKPTAFAIMDQLEGWCSYEKAATLINLVLQKRAEVIVEIGVFGGKSLVPMAYAQKIMGFGKTYGIDPWDADASVQNLQDPANRQWWASVNHELIFQNLQAKIKAFGLDPQIELIRKTSSAAEPIDNIDFLHIDGNHSEVASLFDVLKWVPLVKKGGVIVFDDLQWHENGMNTTARAVEWLNANCIRFSEAEKSPDWGIWIKP